MPCLQKGEGRIAKTEFAHERGQLPGLVWGGERTFTRENTSFALSKEKKKTSGRSNKRRERPHRDLSRGSRHHIFRVREKAAAHTRKREKERLDRTCAWGRKRRADLARASTSQKKKIRLDQDPGKEKKRINIPVIKFGEEKKEAYAAIETSTRGGRVRVLPVRKKKGSDLFSTEERKSLIPCPT